MNAVGGTQQDPILSLRFQGHVSMEEVDARFSELALLPLRAASVRVDLDAAETFDVAALLKLVSVTAERREVKLRTLFRLPSDRRARHRLRQWQFPAAVSAATRTPFRFLVEPQDRAYFGEDPPDLLPTLEESGSPRSSVLSYLIERQLFGLRPYPIETEIDRTRLLDDEADLWSGFALAQLLDRLLKGPAPDIVRVLVPALASSVLVRPDARFAVVGSQLDLSDSFGRPGSDGRGTLTLAVWSSGRSVISALRGYLKHGPGQNPAVSSSSDEFVVQATGWTPSTGTHGQRRRPGAGAEDPEVLIDALGVGAPFSVSATESPQSHYRLHELYKTVIDTFDGTLDIHTERTRLHMSGDPEFDGARYRIHATAGPRLPRQSGDLVAIRLPVRDA